MPAIGIALAVLAVAQAGCLLLLLSNGRDDRLRATAIEEAAAAVRIRERAVSELDERITLLEARSAKLDSVARSFDSLDDLGASLDYYEELAFHVEYLLRQLELAVSDRGNTAAGAPVASSDARDPDAVARSLELNELLSERTRAYREQRVQEFRITNARLRRRWIERAGQELGFDRQQIQAVTALYDRQSDRWDGLYARARDEGLSSAEFAGEAARIRGDADRELESILGKDLKERFRSGEGMLFPQPATPPR